jgi:hypothetical protein
LDEAVRITPQPTGHGHRLTGERSTVAEALKVLEWAGGLSWQNRITRILVRERDLFGQWARRWQVVRTSNAYVFNDPKPALREIPTETPVLNQIPSRPASAINPNSPWSVPLPDSAQRSQKGWP